MLILILFSFLAGIATVLSPCILPLLPIILSASIASGKRRPMGIVVGFVISFSFFALALTAIVRATNLSPDALRSVAVVILFLFGMTMLIPKIQLVFEKILTKLSGFAKQSDESTGFWGGIIVGASLGLIWTPCVGPIMASVLTLAATSSVTIQAVFITLAYAIGTAVPMFFIIYGGRGLLNKVPFLVKNTEKIQKAFGVLLILLAIGIFYNIDRRFQSYILDKFPSYGETVTSIENFDVVKNALEDAGMKE